MYVEIIGNQKCMSDFNINLTIIITIINILTDIRVEFGIITESPMLDRIRSAWNIVSPRWQSLEFNRKL